MNLMLARRAVFSPLLVLLCALSGCASLGSSAGGSSTGQTTSLLKKFYDNVRPALVAVQFDYDQELGKHEIIGGGIVIREDGLVMIPIDLVPLSFPDEQLKNFKILVPSDTGDPEEVPAAFIGRDERSDVAFIQAQPAAPTAGAAAPKWTAIHFLDRPVEVGDTVYGLGMLPKSAGYKPYLNQAVVASKLRGEVPQVVVSGGVGNVGSPVFDSQFRAIGIVQPQTAEELTLDARNELTSIIIPPHFFVPASYYLSSISNPPSAQNNLKMAWMGVPQMTGVNKQFSDFLGLTDRPAVQIGDVVPGYPAALAGLEGGSIIVGMNGKPLRRGDMPEELPLILRRDLLQMKIGDKVTFTVLTAPEKGATTKDVTITLGERPRQPNQAQRYFAKDLGFVAREAVFLDDYTHKMKPDAKGVVVDLVKRDGAAASAKLGERDWIKQLNGQPVTDLNQFKQDYEAFRKAHAHDMVVLVVHRPAGREETINIEPPQSDAAPGAPTELP